MSWDALRSYGPLVGHRYDPHPPPVGDHPDYSVAYTALDIATAAAEVFQTTRRIRAAGDLQLTAWEPIRELRLLDLTRDWALRNRAAHSLTAAPKPTCRAWSNAIVDTWPDLDGLLAASTLTGRENVVLFQPAADSYPAAPAFSRPLDNPAVRSVLAEAAGRIGYRITP